MENPERKKLLVKSRRGWKVNINIYLKEKGKDDEAWTGTMAECRKHDNKSSGAIQYGVFLD